MPNNILIPPRPKRPFFIYMRTSQKELLITNKLKLKSTRCHAAWFYRVAKPPIFVTIYWKSCTINLSPHMMLQKYYICR